MLSGDKNAIPVEEVSFTFDMSLPENCWMSQQSCTKGKKSRD